MIDCRFYNTEFSELRLPNKHKNIGASAIFEGTVRADTINHQKVIGIEFSTQETIATNITEEILLRYTKTYDLIDAIIYHRTGFVKAGEICFKVVINSGHRKEAFEALALIVDEFKANVPVFGKELLEDNSYEWKSNK